MTTAYAIREAELLKLPKHILADMHVQQGGLMGRPVYMKWRKDELVFAILECDGLDPES